MTILQNTTSRQRQINARHGPGYISLTFQAGQILEDIPAEAVKILKSNPAVKNWFRIGVIREFTPEQFEKYKKEKEKVKEPVNVDKANVKKIVTTMNHPKGPKALAKKAKEEKAKSKKSKKGADDDLGI